MSPLVPFLTAAKKRIERGRALECAVRGAAVAAAGALVVQLVALRWPADPVWPPLTAAVAAGGAVAVLGWARQRPSLLEVARLAEVSLGGRERLSTAWELAGHGGPLARRQRADAEAWVASADPRRMARRRLPRRTLSLALAGATLAGALAIVPNGALARLRAGRAHEAARERGADEVAVLAASAAKDDARQGGQRRGALVAELRATERALRRAPTNAAAVAALSRAQTNLKALADASPASPPDATAAAGTELARSAAAAGAGAALAAAGGAAGEELEQLAAASAAAGPEARAELASELREAAQAAPDPEVAARLAKAAEELAAGRAVGAGTCAAQP